MTGAEFFTFLYPIVPVVGLCGYAPQIMTLVKTQVSPESISLPTWLIWTLTWIISLGYAVFALGDMLFTATSGMNLVGHILIVALTIYKRWEYGGFETPLFVLAKT